MQITFASVDSLELMQKLPSPTRTAEEGEELPSPEAVARRRARDEERRQQAVEKTRRDREAKESDPEWRIGEEKDEEESDSDADGRRRGRGRGRGGGVARRGSRQQQQRAAKKTAPITTNSAAAAASASSSGAAAAAAPQPTVLPTPITALYDLMGLAIPGTPRKPLENLSPRQKRRRRHQEELFATIEMIHKTTPAALQLAMATAAKMGSESPLLNALPSTPGSQTRRPKRKRESEETATADSAAAAAAVIYDSSSSSHATAEAATQKYNARDRRDAMLQEYRDYMAAANRGPFLAAGMQVLVTTNLAQFDSVIVEIHIGHAVHGNLVTLTHPSRPIGPLITKEKGGLWGMFQDEIVEIIEVVSPYWQAQMEPHEIRPRTDPNMLLLQGDYRKGINCMPHPQFEKSMIVVDGT